MVSKFRRQADACQEIWALYDGKYASKMCADYLRIGSKFPIGSSKSAGLPVQTEVLSSRIKIELHLFPQKILPRYQLSDLSSKANTGAFAPTSSILVSPYNFNNVRSVLSS